MGMFNPTLIGSPTPPGAGSASGPTLIARRRFIGSTTDTVPPLATRATIRCVGTGGGIGGGYGGQGGAYARDDIKVSAGQTATITVPTPDGTSDGGAVSVSLAGKTVSAQGGYSGTNRTSTQTLSGSIGSVIRLGGAVSAGGDGLAGDHGGNGGTSNSGNVPAGGGSAGDIGDADSLGLGGKGGGFNGYPGFGGGSGQASTGGPTLSSTGIAFIEYWTS